MDDQNLPNLKNPLSMGSNPVGNQPPKPFSSAPRPFAPPVPPPIPPRPVAPPPPPMAPKIISQTSESVIRPFVPPPPASVSGGDASRLASSLPSEKISESVPRSSSPEVNIRSLESDTSSLKSSGGISPSPRTIRLEELGKGPTSFTPETISQLSGGVESGGGVGRNFRGIFKILGSLVFVIGLGFVGYYIIYPLLFPAQSPIVPIVNTEPIINEIERVSHQSIFVTSPAYRADLILGNLSIQDVITTLQGESANSIPSGSLKELSLSDAEGQLAFSKFISTMAPTINPNDVAVVVEDDFTGFLYYNDRGVWPGYVVKLRSGALVSDAESILSALEGSDIRSFYISEPGISEGFKTGPYKGSPIRYASFSTPGASFNYGIIGDYAIFSSSFDGIKAATEYLGL